ncbi:MAG: 16S rRNA (guanine(966)-N(2))-methyltransferase RsmD [Thermaerobacterales bacterium]
MGKAGECVRVTGGELRGRRLAAPPGRDVRPTADRVREAMFSMLGQNLSGERVFDLFAGSGALGIEALSRGAEHSLFVEKQTAVLRVLEKNVEQLGLWQRVTVWRQDAAGALKNMVVQQIQPATLVFMDPPYEQGWVLPILAALLENRCLSNQARIVVEHGKREQIASPPDGLALIRQRSYGRAELSLLQRETKR